jgi:glycosyltransferase involved in cell wall biosynthesis
MLKLSVILPTLNRLASLRVTLRSLAGQTLPLEDYEVIVVDDGSTDDTPETLEEPWPFRLRVIRQANRGAVESRNTAARVADGEVLVFVDDDMTFDGGYLEATAALHAAVEPRVGMGSLLPDDDEPASMFHCIYAVLNADIPPFPPEVQVPFTTCVTNNVSVRKATFWSLGGFRNPVGDGPGTWTDVDFGCRAFRAGIECWRSGRALCVHRDYSIHSYDSALRRSYRVASMAPALFDAHPWVLPHLPMFADKLPVAWREDSGRLIARKLLRKALSSAVISSILQAVARSAATVLPLEALLRPLYRWTLGAELYRGLRDGLRQTGGGAVHERPAPAASNG